MIDLSKCNCLQPGFCPIFNRTMGFDPPDWNWCQKTNEIEREKYRDLLLKAPSSKNEKLMQLYYSLKSKGKEKWFSLYFLTVYEKHKCKTSLLQQELLNEAIISYIENQNPKKVDFSNIEILCLGHNEKQFSTIEDRPYLTKVNLNKIDAGKYSDNEWAESRAFISRRNLFKKNTDFIGFTTASWNCKYEFNRIDNFHNWENAQILLNSKPEDKIILCADVFCPCDWLNGEILSSFIKRDAISLGNLFLETIGLSDFRHINVPYSNQMILHKAIFKQYTDYLFREDILSKIDSIYETFLKENLFDDDDVKREYINKRIKAYMMEMFTCFWFSKQDFIYIPNVRRREYWYDKKFVIERMKE